jgi:hypothetical protein
MEAKRKPPNPNGNPNFRSRWDKLGETSTVRLPQSLHSLFKNLSTAINSGKISTTDLTSLISKPHLEIVPDPIPADDSHAIALKLIEQFEQEQRKSWGKAAKQTGEFNTNSPRWTKYNDFKTWLANQGE